jgi:hypothetical protein
MRRRRVGQLVSCLSFSLDINVRLCFSFASGAHDGRHRSYILCRACTRRHPPAWIRRCGAKKQSSSTSMYVWHHARPTVRTYHENTMLQKHRLPHAGAGVPAPGYPL